MELTSDDRVVLAGTQKLAGSALRMNNAIANLMRIGGREPAGRDPDRNHQPGAADRSRRRRKDDGWSTGERGDLVVFRRQRPQRTIAIEAVYLDGVRVA